MKFQYKALNSFGGQRLYRPDYYRWQRHHRRHADAASAFYQCRCGFVSDERFLVHSCKCNHQSRAWEKITNVPDGCLFVHDEKLVGVTVWGGENEDWVRLGRSTHSVCVPGGCLFVWDEKDYDFR